MYKHNVLGKNEEEEQFSTAHQIYFHLCIASAFLEAATIKPIQNKTERRQHVHLYCTRYVVIVVSDFSLAFLGYELSTG